MGLTVAEEIQQILFTPRRRLERFHPEIPAVRAPPPAPSRIPQKRASQRRYG
ncbi:MAG: hypothetical protein GY820_09755 [Gammaproteobacteria bacterium]|nr:hypothetical protein [Gammaproteobacteria bacterium]